MNTTQAGPDWDDGPTILQRVDVARYLSIAALAVLLYDIFLTFADEVQVIWSQKRFTIPKLAYVINRYGACLTSSLYLAFLLPQTTHTSAWVILSYLPYSNFCLSVSYERCMRTGLIVQNLIILTDTIGNGIILYELIRLWACKRKVAWLMASGYMIMHTCIIVSFVFVLINTKNSFQFFIIHDRNNGPDVALCVNESNPSVMKGVYIPGVVLDIYSFVLLLTNALSKPRSMSERLLSILWSDGLIFFLTTLSMRVLCLVLISSAPGEIAAMSLIFGSMVVAVAVSRLFLRMNESRNPTYMPYNSCGADRDSFLSDSTELQCRNVKTPILDD